MIQLRPGYAFIERTINIHMNYGGLGDMIARLPAVRWIGENWPHVRATIYWHNYFLGLLPYLLPQYENIRHMSNGQMALADDTIPLIDFDPSQINSLALNLVEHGFLMLAQKLPPSDADYVYPRYTPGSSALRAMTAIALFNLDKFVIVTPCATSDTRVWPAEEINNFMLEVKALGYQVVLLGRTEPLQVGNGLKINGGIPIGLDESLADLNLIDQVSLPECLEIIARASAVVGVDNGLLHMAACTGTPTVWGFTSVQPKARLPRGVVTEVVTPDVSCQGCQSRAYLVKHDFRSCMYDDYQCTKEMRATKFITALKKVLAIKA